MTNNKLDKQNKELDSTTDSKEFKPTPHMVVWLDTAIKTGSGVIDHIGKESGIDESNWYRWLKMPGFIDWYTTEWDKRIRSWGPKLDTIGMKRAERDYKYWEAMQERTGRKIGEKQSPSVAIQNNSQGDMSVEFTDS